MARSICHKCERPSSVCLCDAISPQENSIPVLILRHDDEVTKSLNTVNLIDKSLSQIEIWDGVHFPETQFRSWLAEKSFRAPLLLYPKQLSSERTHNLLSGNSVTDQHRGEVSQITCDIDCLVVLDGTWRNTREMLIVNDWLKTLDTLSVINCPPSQYLIRLAREASSLSTIEAVGYVMAAFDKRFDFDRLVRPFHQMIEYQIDRMGTETFRRNYLPD